MLIGHQKIIDFLDKSARNDKLAHAYLFIGPENIGKRAVALKFTKSLQCQNRQMANSKWLSACGKCRSCLEIEKGIHPDVLIIEPEIIETKGKKREKDITIEQVRNIQQKLSLFPYYGPQKIIIIDGAGKMRREAANALLKTLEEPASDSIIILISSSISALLPTVVSRCLSVKFSLVASQDIYDALPESLKKKYSGKEIKKILRQSFGRPGLALSLFQDPLNLKKREKNLEELAKILKGDLTLRFGCAELLSKDLEETKEALGQWLIVFRDLLLEKVGCGNLTMVVDFEAKEKSGANSIISSAVKSEGGIFKLKAIIRKIEETSEIISNPSFNARLALDVLMLNLT